jgi:hypothetical protein
VNLLSASIQQHINTSQATAIIINFSLFSPTCLPTNFKMTDAHIAGGHKATINNPNASEEAKENSRQVLENEFNGGDGKTSKHPFIGNVAITFVS